MKSHVSTIDVAVVLPVYQLFTYAVPETMVSHIGIGVRVLVPFGRRTVTGFIMKYSDKQDHRDYKLIIDVLDKTPLLTPSMIPFFQWIADYYLYPIGEVIKSALPSGLTIDESLSIGLTPEGLSALAEHLPNSQEKLILQELQAGAMGFKQLQKKIGASIPRVLIHNMIDREWVQQEDLSKETVPETKRHARRVSGKTILNTSEKVSVLLDILDSKKEIAITDLNKRVSNASRILKTLEKQGMVEIFSKTVYHDSLGTPVEPDTPPQLTADQQKVIDTILESLGNGFRTFLIAGVTGSGKTEIYLNLAQKVLDRGLSVLVLVPEITLISQMEKRFRARFGNGISILHSRMTRNQRMEQWHRIASKKVHIVIGTRSAIFSPLDQPGIIIVDEEHDTSYKQESRLKYNARDLAVVRAKLSGSIAVLGSATPSIQSYYNALNKKFIELNLDKRVEDRALPKIQIVDLRKPKSKEKKNLFISDELLQATKTCLENGEQAIYYFNRRGFANFPVCGVCGESLRCRNCDITLTYHKAAKAYKCHYCGYMQPAGIQCPICASSGIRRLGMGTEKIEADIKKLFPGARVFRMDRDTMQRKNAIVSILKDLRDRRIDILIGTQMVTKGHDYPYITLVGIICADLSLNFPDFRAGERTFQVLAQVAGRAGRGDRSGQVILQTFNPEHFSISCAGQQDFRAFYDIEIKFRKALKYPPFSRMVQFRISGLDREKTRETARTIGKLSMELKNRYGEFNQWIQLMGPSEAPIIKIANRYRWLFMIRSEKAGQIQRFVRLLASTYPSVLRQPKVRVSIDVDPYSMM